MNDNAQQRLLEHLGVLVGPLRAAAESEYLLRNFARSVGWDLDEITGLRIGELQARLNEFISSFETLSGLVQSPPQTLSELSAALDAADRTFHSIQQISTILAEGTQPSQFKEFGRDLISAMTIAHLHGASPVLFHLAVLLTIIEPASNNALSEPVFDSAGKLVRVPHSRPKLRLGRIVDLIKSPEELLKGEYLGEDGLKTAADARRAADKLFPRIGAVLAALGANVAYGFKPGYGIDLGDPDNLAAGMLAFWLEPQGVDSQAGATLSLSPAEQGDLGLVVSPFGSVEFTQPLDRWALSASLTAGIDAFALGPSGFRLLLGEGGSGDRVSAKIELSRRVESEGSVTHIGSTTGTRLEAKRLRILAEANLNPAEQDYGLLAEVGEAALVVAPGNGDGFLQAILPVDGLRANFDLAFGWSNRLGFYFRGSTGLEAQLPIHASFGPISVESVYLAIRAEGEVIKSAVAVTASVRLGPVTAVVERVGIAAALTFPQDGGNLGVADLDFGFKPPTGVGLTVDASVVVGGGFLSFDSQKHEYSGVLELQIVDKIAVKAIGLLTTRLPDGSKGYSLVLIIFVEGFTPIQLGFGFALTGVGGLLGVNRTFSETALRAGLKNHTLDSVMFPRDPIRNAPQIISNLNRVFPPAADHHLFGPMVQISWGTPALITAEIGVVLELGARLRLLILAQIAAILPRRDHELVRLQMDAIGIIDFDQGTASLDAALYDSRLLKKFVLTGEMALRLKWEDSPHFALAVGGLHPAFQPPPTFPKLERIAINFSSGDNPRIRCEAYFAITANTVQFGARAELYAAASGFSIHGEIGYDVLIQFDPFFFIAEFHAQLQLKRGSTSLFKVKVEGSLAGPRPLHLKGKATFEILWWDVTVRVDTTLIKGEKPPGPAPIEVLPRLKEALRHPDNWTTQMPVGQRPLVTLNARPGAADILLHPLGTLLVRENVVPLNMDISRFGQAVPAGERRFMITGVTVGEEQQVGRSVRDFFAPAQFLELTDDEKLSRPSFEQMDAGVTFLSDAIVFTTDARDWLEVESIEFETWILDKGTNVAESDDEEGEQGRTLFYRLSPLLLSTQSRFGAAGSSELRRTGRARYHTGTAKHQMAREGWTIVDREQLSEQTVTGVADRAPTYSEAVAELRKLKQETPTQASRFKILRPSELQRV